MEPISDVVGAVRAIVFDADGISSSYKDIPTKPPAGLKLPAALSRIDLERRGLIDMGSEEYWRHPIRIDVLIDDERNVENSFATVEPFILAVIEQLRSHATVLGLGAFEPDVQYWFGPLALWDTTYWGASLFIWVQQQFSTVTLIEP